MSVPLQGYSCDLRHSLLWAQPVVSESPMMPQCPFLQFEQGILGDSLIAMGYPVVILMAV